MLSAATVASLVAPVAAGAPPSHDARRQARPIEVDGLPASARFSNAEATMGGISDWDEDLRTRRARPLGQGLTHEVCGQPAGASVWYSIQVQSQMTVSMDTRGSEFDTVLAVWVTNSRGELEAAPVACNDDADEGRTLQSHIAHLELSPLVTYYVQVTGWRGAEGAGVLNTDLLSASLAGTVSFEDGQPADFACIRLWDEGAVARSAVTSDQGAYRFIVPAGRYSIEATDCSQRRFHPRRYGSDVEAAAGERVAGLDLVVTRRAAVPDAPLHDEREAATKIVVLPTSDRTSTHKAGTEVAQGANVLEQVGSTIEGRGLEDPPAGAEDLLLGEPKPGCLDAEPPLHTIWYRFRPNHDVGLTVSVRDPLSEHLPFVAVWAVNPTYDRAETRLGRLGMEEVGCDRASSTHPTAQTDVDLAGERIYLVQVGSRPAGEASYAGGFLEIDFS